MEISVNYRIMSLNSRLFILSLFTSFWSLLSEDLCGQKVSAASGERESFRSDFVKSLKNNSKRAK